MRVDENRPEVGTRASLLSPYGVCKGACVPPVGAWSEPTADVSEVEGIGRLARTFGDGGMPGRLGSRRRLAA